MSNNLEKYCDKWKLKVDMKKLETYFNKPILTNKEPI